MEGFTGFEGVSGWYSQTVTSWRITTSIHYKYAKALMFKKMIEDINCGGKNTIMKYEK